MYRQASCFFLILSALLSASADPSWKHKPIVQWSADDASKVLSDSPWVKQTPVALLPERSEGQLREGGRMGGGGKRAGLGSLGGFSEADGPRKLEVRWESAAPVRAAELVSHESGPEWEGEYYAIAVYGVPGITPSIEKRLRSELKQLAFLKCKGKKDQRPARVDIVLFATNQARVTYLFPRSSEITPEDMRIEFVSQIGRLYVAQVFDIREMQFQGKLLL
jgi:hypothetical protein